MNIPNPFAVMSEQIDTLTEIVKTLSERIETAYPRRLITVEDVNTLYGLTATVQADMRKNGEIQKVDFSGRRLILYDRVQLEKDLLKIAKIK